LKVCDLDGARAARHLERGADAQPPPSAADITTAAIQTPRVR